MTNNQLEIDIAEYILTHDLLEEFKVDAKLLGNFGFMAEDALVDRLQYEIQRVFNLDSETIQLIINSEFVIKLGKSN
jgi:hypothetical protein